MPIPSAALNEALHHVRQRHSLRDLLHYPQLADSVRRLLLGEADGLGNNFAHVVAMHGSPELLVSLRKEFHPEVIRGMLGSLNSQGLLPEQCEALNRDVAGAEIIAREFSAWRAELYEPRVARTFIQPNPIFVPGPPVWQAAPFFPQHHQPQIPFAATGPVYGAAAWQRPEVDPNAAFARVTGRPSASYSMYETESAESVTESETPPPTPTAFAWSEPSPIAQALEAALRNPDLDTKVEFDRACRSFGMTGADCRECLRIFFPGDQRGAKTDPELIRELLEAATRFPEIQGCPEHNAALAFWSEEQLRLQVIDRYVGDREQYARTLNFRLPNGELDMTAADNARQEHKLLLSRELNAIHFSETGRDITPLGIERYMKHCVGVARQRHCGEGLAAGAAGFGGSGFFSGWGAVVGAFAGSPAGPLGMAFGKTLGQTVGQVLSPWPVSYNIAAVNIARARFDLEHPLQAVRVVRPGNDERELNQGRLGGFATGVLPALLTVPAARLLSNPGNEGLQEAARTTLKASVGLAFCTPAWVSAAGWGGYHWRQSEDPWLFTGPVKRVDPAQNDGRNWLIDRDALRAQFGTIYEMGVDQQAARDIRSFERELLNPWHALKDAWTAWEKDAKTGDTRQALESFLSTIQRSPAACSLLIGIGAAAAEHGDPAAGLLAYNLSQPFFWAWSVLSNKAFCKTRSIANVMEVAKGRQPQALESSAASVPGSEPACSQRAPLEEAPSRQTRGEIDLACTNGAIVLAAPIVANVHQAAACTGMTAGCLCAGCLCSWRSDTADSAPRPPPAAPAPLAQNRPAVLDMA